tara:strand:+ start:40 stop:1116 length:1077 start_codon:yes stop_codon:yes gene_type:complete
MISKSSNISAKDYELFLNYSKELGLDRTMVQAAGGNTSIKDGDTMWIKASGKWLIDTGSSETMAAVSISKIKDALKNNNCSYDDILKSVDLINSPKRLRPSIESPMHAILNFKYIFHTHDIYVNALAVQKNSHIKFKEILSDLNWKFIPYVKPGIELCRKIMEVKTQKDDIFILENHGLIICGEDLEEIKKLNQLVRYRLKEFNDKTNIVDKNKSNIKIVNLKNTGFKFCEDNLINKLAFHQPWIDKLTTGTLLPDFLVFLGPKLLALDPKANGFVEKLDKISKEPLPLNSCVILIGHGVIIRDNALRGTVEIIRCIYDLLCLIPDNVDLQYLSENEISFLLNWEAEHYRQSQNKKIL